MLRTHRCTSAVLFVCGICPFSAPPAPESCSGELAALHSQLLVLTETIELLLSRLDDGGSDSSNGGAGPGGPSSDIENDLLVLHSKFVQFQAVTEEASLEVLKLSQWSERACAWRRLS